ncbi:MAG: prolipoprotein diacylglyceryl transferase [Nitrospirota bacterium]
MHPILFKLGPLTVHTYGLLIATAFLAAMTFAAHEGKRKGIDPDRMLDLGLWILVAAIVGSRVFQVAVEHKYYFRNPIEILEIWKGGLVFYGGFIFAVFVGVWYLSKHKMPVWKTADVLAPCIALGQAIGRLGCLSAGCCFGKPTSLPWGITFTDPDSLANPLGLPLHPTQAYESIGDFLIFAFLFLYRKRIKFDGQLFWMYVIMYSVLRFVIEFFRGDAERGFVHVASFDLSTSQAVGIVAFLTAVVALTQLKRKAATA